MTPETKAKAQPIVVNYSKIRVSVRHGPDAGAQHDVVSNTLRIGTASENDLMLTDTTVSRRHCAIEPLVKSVRVRDEGSTNGVFLAGVRIYDAVIARPVELEIGDSVIGIEFLRDNVAREQSTETRFGSLIGGSSRMRELFASLSRIAASDLTLLIEGETGSGKELVAESVHGQSRRNGEPWVVFDCSAVAPNLIESELFGHEKGAFTGAITARAGVFEQADKGTVFFDELGELPKDLQPKLLRALERREVRRLGAQRSLSVDVRLIAATNKNLAAEVRRGNFREDLYFRLAAARVVVPPLRDRMDDLPLLVEHFLSRAKPPRQLSDVPRHVWDMFNAHRWPGNVRELSNAVQRFLVTPDLVFPDQRPAKDADESASLEFERLRIARREAGDRVERAYVQALLMRTGGNVTRAAEIADMSRQMLQKLLRKHSIH